MVAPQTTVLYGDAWDLAPTLEPETIDCIVTSPPYWGLRDYGHEGQFGLEATPEEYVDKLVGLFDRLRPALKATGTVWLNLGDCYASDGGPGTGGNFARERRAYQQRNAFRVGAPGHLKPKDLVGIPWRVALALQTDGWWLRSDIIWSKPNPMPESVTDRPATSHEHVFLLTKSERYFFDREAVREPDSGQDHRRAVLDGQPSLAPPGQSAHTGIRTLAGRNGDGRNIRNVWTISTQPFVGAHFAVFPEALVERCIKAGTSEHGICPECGRPWERVIEAPGGSFHDHESDLFQGQSQQGTRRKRQYLENYGKRRMVGWRAGCSHDLAPLPASVLDPFAGSGTTLYVARKLGRDSVGFELNEEYEPLIKERLKQGVLL